MKIILMFQTRSLWLIHAMLGLTSFKSAFLLLFLLRHRFNYLLGSYMKHMRLMKSRRIENTRRSML